MPTGAGNALVVTTWGAGVPRVLLDVEVGRPLRLDHLFPLRVFALYVREDIAERGHREPLAAEALLRRRMGESRVRSNGGDSENKSPDPSFAHRHTSRYLHQPAPADPLLTALDVRCPVHVALHVVVHGVHAPSSPKHLVSGGSVITTLLLPPMIRKSPSVSLGLARDSTPIPPRMASWEQVCLQSALRVHRQSGQSLGQ